MRRRHGHLEREALHAPDAFAEHTRLYSHCFAAPLPEGEAIVRRIARKHCAGMAGPRPTGTGILAALSCPPDVNCADSRAVSWMLSTIQPHECAILVTCCGVRVEDLARHVRVRGQQRPAIVRFLNQFAIIPEVEPR